ncbi:(2Fe-2S)-binding protein [Dyella acidiphila]|uniref:(2Fe-2S)-binding protein n=1 Tax=Dyella acidiphila TaxID=2775866 RepID=A0ABR9GCU8_9GAMM|nr:(2Fe-2S)-binding protein [Dyella acidiphila]MBE1161877.1 (2Fe-2S)-binding protein [Dyella acidiphila]
MSAARLTIDINGHALEVAEGISVAAAIAILGLPFRRSVGGQWRAPLCGMGVCFECRVRIDGLAQQRACMTIVRAGMQVCTDD